LVFVRCSYLKILGLLAPSLPKGTLKRKGGRSDSIRSIGFAEDHRFNVRWLKEAWRILKPQGTIWVTGTHHIIFSLGFALQSLRFKVINVIRS
jgi:site-specific DNA-methyltransferase (adenine-specific)